MYLKYEIKNTRNQFLDSIAVSIPACHAGDRGSTPRRGELNFTFIFCIFFYTYIKILYSLHITQSCI